MTLPLVIKNWLEYDIAERIEKLPIQCTQQFSRKILQYGKEYIALNKILIDAQPIPDFLVKLKNEIEVEIKSKLGRTVNFDQCLINIYKKGQFIGAHTDNVDLFDEIIACVNLLETVYVVFLKPHEHVCIKLDPNDLLIQYGDIRYNWTHETTKAKKNRISITFRTIKK